MSYYFAIIGTQDNPLFEYEFGTSKQGGDGQPRFSEQARHLNQFILHSSLDVVEEVQWNNGQMYAYPYSSRWFHPSTHQDRREAHSSRRSISETNPIHMSTGT